MSADIINLNKARKLRAKKQAETLASSNRAKHGRTKAEKLLERAEKKQLLDHLEAHQLSPRPIDTPGPEIPKA